MQKLGQHFLNNDLVIEKMIVALDLKKGSAIIEIGPGRGALTIPLAVACETAGCRLVAIEKDAALAKTLADVKIKNVEVVVGDALKLLPTIIATAISNNENYSVVGNIPYYITGKLLRIMSEMKIKPRQCMLMVQREVAERMCAAPPAMNRLSASVQFWANPKVIAAVPKKDFIPPPNVDSAVVLLNKKSGQAPIESDRYYQTVRAVFAQPRKTILNNLSSSKNNIPKNELEEVLKKLDIKPDDRPQDLSIEKLAAIAGAVGITL